jgi:hypothetical protein
MEGEEKKSEDHLPYIGTVPPSVVHSNPVVVQLCMVVEPAIENLPDGHEVHLPAASNPVLLE